jgi:eukaryotic-like serine/threonine-protein kinase
MSDASDRDVMVFTEALQLPAGQRAAYLDLACGGDSELRRKVEVLLAGHAEVGDFLEHSPHETTV